MRYYSTKQLHKIIPTPTDKKQAKESRFAKPALAGEKKSKKQIELPTVKPEMDCKIQKSMYGEYFFGPAEAEPCAPRIVPYVCIPKEEKKTCENPVAIDPGVRKFLTTYAPNSKESFMFGNRWATSITEECLKLDKMYSTLSKERDVNKKKKIKAAIKRKRKRISNLRHASVPPHAKKELRDQCASFISQRYDTILLPKLEAGKLCIKANRKLSSKTVRSFLNAGHCKFFDTLKDKCWQHGSKFPAQPASGSASRSALHVREEYTSQTCPCCGSIKKCNEVYKCPAQPASGSVSRSAPNCGFKHDRDIVGAFNILLKAVRDTKPKMPK